MVCSNTYDVAYAFVTRLDKLSGRNQSNSFSFSRVTKNWSGTCYSYSTKVAELCKTIAGSHIMVIIDGWHTRTTQKQLSALRGAAAQAGIEVIRVPRPIFYGAYYGDGGIPHTFSDKDRPVGYDGYRQMLVRMMRMEKGYINKRDWREDFLWAFYSIGHFKRTFGHYSLSKETYRLLKSKDFLELLARVIDKQTKYQQRYGQC